MVAWQNGLLTAFCHGILDHNGLGGHHAGQAGGKNATVP